MKYIKLLFIVFVITSCNNDYLERYPLDSLNQETYWKSANDLKIYNNRLYSDAISYGLWGAHWNSAWSSGFYGMSWADCQSDNYAPRNSALNGYAKVAAGINTVADSRGWSWGFLRTCNVFLENYQKTEISEIEKNWYAGETRLFRAWFYWVKVKQFGDVPWVEKSLNIDSEELYGERNDRSFVMDKVLEDLIFACENMPETWPSNHENRLNKWGALAIASRICLHEGTFRKYHGLPGYDTWLTEAKKAAEKVVKEGPYELNSTNNPDKDYQQVFNQLDLTDNSEVIFFMKYIDGVLAHRMLGYQMARSNGMTKDAVEDYLCIDGQTITQSPLYLGDDSLTVELSNRDPRLTQTILHPHNKEIYAGSSHAQYDYPRFLGMTGGYKTSTGYQVIKYFSSADYNKGFGHEENDAPLIRLAETMLILAEAKEELGELSQADLDITINKLRARVGMPHLTINPPMDPKYQDLGISSNLVEIRRERRVELMGEGYRYDDLMRWKMGLKLNNKVVGMRWETYQQEKYVTSEGNPADVKTVTIDGKTYIDVYKGTDFEARSFEEPKNYLFPIPLGAISQNQNLGQNPGW